MAKTLEHCVLLTRMVRSHGARSNVTAMTGFCDQSPPGIAAAIAEMGSSLHDGSEGTRKTGTSFHRSTRSLPSRIICLPGMSGNLPDPSLAAHLTCGLSWSTPPPKLPRKAGGPVAPCPSGTQGASSRRHDLTSPCLERMADVVVGRGDSRPRQTAPCGAWSSSASRDGRWNRANRGAGIASVNLLAPATVGSLRFAITAVILPSPSVCVDMYT